MKSTKVNLSILIMIILVFLFSPQISSASVESIKGCHKPYTDWLYPENGFTLSGKVTVYWTGAEADYYEHIVYRLYFVSFESNFYMIDNALGDVSAEIDTTQLPQGEGDLYVGTFDGYTPSNASVRIFINQSVPSTPLDPRVLEQPVCDYTPVEDTSTSPQQLSVDWIIPTLSLFFGLPLIYKKFSVKRNK